MKERLKTLLGFVITFALCFGVIYAFVFFGGSNLFESGDPIMIEVGIAFIVAIFVYFFVKLISQLDKKIEALENKVKELEEKIDNK